MTNQPQLTPAELGARFGSQMGPILSDLIMLEKMVEAQRVQIQEMTEGKANLENEMSLLKSQGYELQRELQQAKGALSSGAAEIAAKGKEVIANEKAALTEAA
jgi:hypothetical protein